MPVSTTKRQRPRKIGVRPVSIRELRNGRRASKISKDS